MADHGLAKQGLDGNFMMYWPLCLTIRTGAEVAHAVDQVCLRLRRLFRHVLKTFLSKISIKTPDALIDLFLRCEPALVMKVAGPDNIEARFLQE